MLVALSLTRTLIFSDDTNHLRQLASQCPIPEWEYPNCRPYIANGDAKPLTPQEWYGLREIYEQVVGKNVSSLVPSWKQYDPTHRVDGFRAKVEVRTSPGMGRGVFLMEPVSEGQVIWDNRYTARFPDDCSVRRFFQLVGEKAACDAITWGYVNDFYGPGQFQVDLDDSAFLNDAKNAEANVVIRFPDELSDPKIIDLNHLAFLEQRAKPGAFQLFARSNIAAGTELLFEYTDVHVYSSAKVYGDPFWYEKLCIMTRGALGWLAMT